MNDATQRLEEHERAAEQAMREMPVLEAALARLVSETVDAIADAKDEQEAWRLSQRLRAYREVRASLRRVIQAPEITRANTAPYGIDEDEDDDGIE